MSSSSGGMGQKILDHSKLSYISKLLISASDAPFERSELPTLVNAILASEQELKLCSEEDANFLTIIAVLSAHHIASGLENVSKVQLQNVLKACRVLTEFLVLRLKYYDSSLGCSQKHVLMVLLGLCKGTGFLQLTDRKSLVNSNEFLQQTLQDIASDDIESKPSGRRFTQDPGALIIEQLMQPVYDASDEISSWDYVERESESQQFAPSDITAVFASKNVQFLMSLDVGTDVIDMCLKLPHLETYLAIYLDAVNTGTLTLPSSTARLSLQSLLNDVTIIHWALSLPILEPLDAERFQNLFTLSASCLVLSVVVTVAMGSQASGSTSKSVSGKDDESDSQAIEIIRKCLEIFRLTCKATRNSTRAGGHHLQNCEMIGAWILLTGLQTILGKPARPTTVTQLQSPKDSQKPIGTSTSATAHALKSKESFSAAASRQSLLRVQQSFSVLAVGLANQAVSLLTSLFRNVHTEPAANIAVTPANLDVLAEFQAHQRIQLIFNGLNLNNLFFNMAAISYRKACSLRRCHEQQTDREAASSSEPNSYYDDDYSSPEEEEDEEDEDDDDDSEPILGYWFEETITPVDSGRSEIPQAPSSGNAAFDNARDLQLSNPRAEWDFVPEKGTPHGFIRLATSVLTFANRYLICTEDALVREYTSSKLCEQHVIILAGLLRDVDREISRSECEPGNTVVLLYTLFSTYLSKLMHNLITLELLSTDLQNLLLTQLGVNPWTGDDWPLQVNSRTLAVVAKVLLLLAQRDRSRFVDESDAACCNIWGRLLQTLQQSILNPVSSGSPANLYDGAEDLNVEHAQLLLFLLQSAPLNCKRMVLLDCANTIASVVNVVDSIMTETQILHLVRLLLIFEYFLKHMYMAPTELVEQVRWNVFGELCTSDLEDSEKKLNRKMYFPFKATANGNEQADDRFYVLCPPFVVGNIVQKPDQLAVNALLNWTQISYAEFQCILMRFFFMGKQWDLTQRPSSEQLSPFTAQLIQCGMEVIWRILLTMPPAASFLKNLHGLSVAEHNKSEMYLVPLASVWASRVAHKRVSIWLKESLGHQGLDADKSNALLSQVVDKCGKLEHDVSVAKSMFSNLLARYDNISTSALLARDEILPTFDVCILDTVVAKLQVSLGEHIKKPSTEVEQQMKEIAEDFIPYVLKMMKLVRKIVRSSLLYQASDKCEADNQLGNSSLHALSIVLELTSSRCLHTASLASSLTELLPASLRSVVKTWNSHGLDDFPLMVDLRTEGSEDMAVCEKYVIWVHHGHWQALASNPQHAANISLKHLLHSLSQFPADMLVWLSEHKLSSSVVDSLFPLIIDGTTENIAQLVTLSVEQLVGTNESEEYLQRVYYYVIAISYDLLVNCNLDCNGVDEHIFHEIVKFLEAALDKTAGRKAMETFFIDDKKDLGKLLLSISNGDMSPNYVSKVLKFFNKLYQLAEKSPNDRCLEALCASLSSLSAADPCILQRWLEKITCTAADSMKNLLSEESSLATVQDNRQQLQILTSYFIKNNSIGEELAHVLLDDLIPMATHVLSCLGQDGCSGFPELLTVMSTLAGVGSSGRGHVKLFKVATLWLATCKTYLLKNNAIKELDDHLLLGSHHGMTEITCRILSYMADVLGAMKVLSDRWDARTGITSPPHDTEFLPQDVDSDWAEEMGQDDDSAAEDSDEDSLSNKLCTFTLTQKEFMNQHWYHCHTCKMVDGVGVCTICAKVCHRDHDVTYAKYGSFFCDCGAKEDGSCQALVKRAAVGNEPATGPSMGSGAAQFASDLALPSSLRRRLSSPAQMDRGSDHRTTRSAVDMASCRKKAVLTSQLESHSDSIIAHLMKEDVAGCVLDLLEKLKGAVDHHCMRNSPVGSIVHLRDSLRELHSKPMNFVQTDQLMVPTLGSQEGAFENVRLTLSGEQGQTIRQLLSAHVIHRVAMCLLAAPSGRRQHLAVSHEKGKITVLQLSTLLRQADSGKRKLTLTRLASAPVPFTVLSMAGNPCNDEVLAVCGLKECHVMTFNTSGTVSDHLALHPQGAFGNFLIKAVWLPGSQTELALVMPDIVKIFDLSEDVVNPQYYFLLPESKIRDCCFVMTEDGSRYALLMCASGHIYMQQLCEESLAKHGSFYVTNVLEVEHPDLQVREDSNGQLCGGGVSVYYSHTLQLLFFSYSRGKTFVASLQTMKNELTDVHLITVKNNGSGKGNGQPLWQWTEVVGHPGLVCCLTQSTNNPVVLMVRPENIFVQEIKVQPAKAKITDMVALRHPVCGTEHRTTLILLCEDGSLRIYTANVDQTGFWLSPSHKVFSGSGNPSARQAKKKKVAKTSRPSGTVAFPVDFFEHCQPMNDVEFGGNDLLQIYNVQQLKHRLNSAGMYVASSRAVGFTLEVTNPDSGMVITGVRVLLGGQDAQRVPSYIEVFNRSVQVALTRNRWYDFPLTREESLQAAKKLSIFFGTSAFSTGVTMVDSIKIYGKSKEVFGWPDDNEEFAAVSPTAGPTPSTQNHEVEGQQMTTVQPLSLFDRILSSILQTLDGCFSVVGQRPSAITPRNAALDLVTGLLTLPMPPTVQQLVKILLATMHPSRLTYHNHKDQALLAHVVASLRATRALTLKDIPQDPDAFYSLVAMARAVAVAHPWNLVRFADCHVETSASGNSDEQSHLAVQLVNAFWKLHSQQPVNVALAPVCKPALANVDLVVQALVEVVHTFAAVDLDDVSLVAKLYTSLLFAEDATVGFACKQVLIRLLRPRVRRRRVCIPSPPRCSTPGASTGVVKRAQRDAAEMLMSLEDTLLVEGGAVGVTVFPAGLDSIPPDADDDEMVELAIALSLQEQVSGGGVTGGPIGVAGNGARYADAAAMAGASDDDEGSTAATDGSTLRTPPAEPVGSPSASASGSRSGSGSESADSIMGGDALAGTGSGRSSANGDHRPESTTTGARSETSSVGAPSTSMPQELEGEVEVEAEGECEGFEAGTDLHTLRLLLLDQLVHEMPQLRTFNGVRAIPYLQVVLMLTSDLDGDEPKDRAALERLLAAALAELGPRTTQVAADTVTRSPHHEVQLVLMRLLSVMMSRPKSSAGGSKSESRESFLSTATANALLSHGAIEFCLHMLRSLLEHWKRQHAQESAQNTNGATAPTSPSTQGPGSASNRVSGSSTCSATLKRHAPYPPPNMSPFFLRQYVKGHADDVFEAFPQLLTEMALRLPYQMKKITDAAAPAFDHDWYYLLCEYMAIPQAPFVRKQVRKLLLFLCGSKERYRQLRDTCSLESGLREVRALCAPLLSQSETQLPYDALLSLVEHLRACAEVATGRTANWQQFCERDDSVLPFLIRISPLLDDGVAAVVLQLLQAAICPKTKDSTMDTLPARLIHRLVDPTLLLDFVRAFLLESATSSVRWQAHALMAGMFEHSADEQRAKLLEMLWHLWPSVPAFVGKAAQFVDLLGHFAIHVPLDACASREHAERAIGLLRSQNTSLSLHPNSGLYSALQVLVELDGYYLEAEPCLVCSDLEVPFANVKLSALKVDSCFTTTTQVVKLIGGHLISRITLRVGDLKRAKMVRTINMYYSQRSAPAVVELKNRPSLWQKARRCSLAAGQTELKVDFPLPITACNLIIEYADFYENAQASSESLQCPRCSTSVPANPGVCANCGENVFQCHKCRAINYDEKDPFLCNFCGFCKYAKFDFTLTARPCCAVDPIENEDDRKKAVLTINTLLEKADRVYRQLSAHKPALEALFRRVIDHSAEVTTAELGAPVSAQNATVAPANITSPSVNRTVLHLAQRYCGDCKNAYEDLTKMIQKVLACRRQLVEYDRRHGCRPGQIVARPTLAGSLREAKTSCYGCAIAAIEHCITLLRALAIDPKTRAILCELGLVRELAENNLRRGSLQVCTDVRMLLCLLVQDNPNATDELNALIMDKVRTAVKGRLPGPDLASAVHQEMTLLATSTKKHDACWERRLRCVVRLFILAVNSRDPVVMEAITLPCLRILQTQVQPPVPVSKKNKERSAEYAANISSADIRLNFRKWLAGDPDHSYQRWEQLSPKRITELDTDGKREEKGGGARISFLSEKYGRRWLQKVHRADVRTVKLTDCEWLRHLVFNPVSRVARQETCTMLEALCLTPARKAEVVNLLTTFLSDLSTVGDNCTEFITLYHNLIKSEQWKSFVAARGLLPSLGQLVTAEIERLSELEDTTLTSNLGEGYALKLLTELMATFMGQESVRRIFKSRLVGTVLNGYLALCKLVIQRTKLVDDAQDKLLELLEEMTAGTENEKETFMSVCIETLAKCPIKDFRTPVFVFERLCSVIHPEDNEVGEFFVTLEKDPQQEDFLQGRMLNNPYSCLDPGLGPLMRDIKNKICQDCELVALLEDDNGMELLVANKIISLDLAVKEVYKKVWLVENGDGEAMRIVYRMRGLLGDATEEFIESLSPPGGEVVDNEEVYRLANCMATCGGLDTMLERLDAIDDLARGRTLLVVLLKLFGYCIKVKRNRHELMKPKSRAVGIMLTKVKQMLSCDADNAPAAQGGLSITEQLLLLMETILMEASEDPTKLHSCGSVEDIRFLLERVMTSQPQRALGASVLQRLMRVMSFLALGSSDKMDEVVAHFKAFTNLSQFDFEHGAKVDHKMECLCVLANGIEPNTFGGKLKSKMIDAGIVQDLLNYIFAHAPSSNSALLGDSDEFKEFICKPALKYILRLLTGLSRGHPPTQQLVIADCIPVIHRLEQVSSDEHVGSLAENLMEVLRENPEVAQKIEDVRKQTRAEKKRMAMAMREKQLAGLGMRTNEKGQVTAKASILKQVEELADESGLVCVICREGYKFQPAKVLCVYTYTKRANADDSENKARKTSAYTTVSHFNVVHVDCHVSAVRLARIRDEWESAALQNGNTRCNGLLPLWGPDVPEPAFANCLARHNTYLQDCTGHRDIGFNSTMHDVKLLLLRFAYEKSFSEDSGGGGPQSNMHLLPYLLHTALYVLNTTRLNSREETNMTAYVDMSKDKWVENCFQVEGPLYWATVALTIHSPTVWIEKRISHLRRLLILAHARHVSPGGTTRLSDKTVKEYAVYKPVLVFFALINNLYATVFKKVAITDGVEWSVALADYIRHNDQALLEAVDKLLTQYQDELLLCASFAEFLDVIGLLEDIPDGDAFLNETLSLQPK